MKLIAGLGNPGARYDNTRHNSGFFAIGRLMEKYGHTKVVKVSDSPLYTVKIEGQEASVIAPMRYMNRSGPVIGEAMAKLAVEPERLLVIHDDIDIELGVCKFKEGGGSAGHNGLKSIIETLGSSDFFRIRIGVGRPPDGSNVTDWVLGDFAPEEDELLEKALGDAMTIVTERFLPV